MSDPVNIQQINNIQKIETDNEVAGAASVQPSYIPSDVPDVQSTELSASIDGVSVSTGVSTSSQVSAAPEKIETEGYIVSSIELPDMDSIEDIADAMQYIDPDNEAVQTLLSTLKQLGMITEDMTADEIANAVHGYVSKNFAYIADKGGDDWSSVAETISRRGGDCEDLANLEASLLMAALIDSGMSADEAASRVSGVVTFSLISGIGHVTVRYITESGKTLYYDPSNGSVSKGIREGQTVLFTYDMEGVNVEDKGFDYSKLATSGYHVDVIPDNQHSFDVAPTEDELQHIQDELIKAEAVAGYLNALAAENTTHGTYNFWDTEQRNAASDMNTCDLMCVDGSLNSVNSILAWVNAGNPFYFAAGQRGKDDVQKYVNRINRNNTANTEKPKAYTAWQTAVSNLTIARSNLLALYDIPDTNNNGIIDDSEIQAVVDQAKAAYLIAPHTGDNNTDLWQVNYDSPLFVAPKHLSPAFSTSEFIDLVSSGELRAEGLKDEVIKALFGAEIMNASAAVRALELRWSMDVPAGVRFMVQRLYEMGITNSEDYRNNYSAISAVFGTEADPVNWGGYTTWTMDITDGSGSFEVPTGVPGFNITVYPGNGYGIAVQNAGSYVIDYFAPVDGESYWYQTSSSPNLNGMGPISPGTVIPPTITNHFAPCTNLFSLMDEYYMPILEARATYESLKQTFVAQYGVEDLNENGTIEDSEIQAVIDELKTDYLRQNADGFWEINPESPLFDPENEDSLQNQISKVKGTLMILSIIYEAKRDLWNLVEEELTGEAGGYKGMKITKLFEKKVNRLEKSFQQLVATILSCMAYSNEAIANEKIMAINAKYDELEAAIWKEEPGVCDDDTRQRRVLDMENGNDPRYRGRINEINDVNNAMKANNEKNLKMAEKMLKSSGMNISVTGLDGWDNLKAELSGGLDNMDSVVRATTDASDDSQYLEIDRDKVNSMRDRLMAAMNMRRIILMAKQAMGDMRNLVHQEMTGIGGREMRTDIAAAMNESEGNEVLTWFNRAISATEEIVSLKNQIRKNELQKQQNQEMIDKLREQEGRGWLSKALSILSTVLSIVSMIPGCQFLQLVAMAASAVNSFLTSSDQRELAKTRLALESKYARYDIKPTDQTYQPRVVSVRSGDEALDIAVGAESSAQQELGDMTSGNYLHTLDDGWKFNITGSSFFDIAAFARAGENIRNDNILQLIANSARVLKADMRNIVHMEMTSIGGRTPSNMTTYAMEAARGQQAFIMNSMYTNISDQNQANNVRYDRESKIKMYEQMVEASNWSLGISIFSDVAGLFFSPAAKFGSLVGKMTSTFMNLNTQSDYYYERAYDRNGNPIDYNTGAVLDESLINDLITNGTVSSGDGNVAVNSKAVSDVAGKLAKAFVASEVEASIKKVMREMRDLVHMEMTGIRGADSGNIAETANIINFQTAMQSLNLAASYLAEKAQLQNRINNARQEYDNIQTKINNLIGGAVFSGIAGGATALALADAGAELISICQLAADAASAVWGLASAANAWQDHSFAKARAEGGMGDLAAYINVKKTMDHSVNSVETRLEQLEEKCLEEILDSMLVDTGRGYIGVNKGMAAKYKAFISGLYRAEKTKAEVSQALQEMRSVAHEIMTGISCATANSASTVVEIKLEAIKSQIDSLFNMLESVVERWNQLTDAKRAELKAEAQAWAATVSALIQTIIVAISIRMATSKKAKARNIARNEKPVGGVNGKEGGLKQAQQNYKADPSQHNFDKLTQAEQKLSDAAIEYDKFAQPFEYAQMALSLLEPLAQLAMASVQRSVMRDNEKAADAKVSATGIKANNGSSAVMDANYVPAGFEDMSASVEATSGKAQLESKRKTNALHDMEDDAALNDVNRSVRDDAIFNKSVTVAKLAKSILFKDEDTIVGIAPKARKSAQGSDVKAAQPLTKAEVQKLTKQVEDAAKILRSAQPSSQAAQQAAQQIIGLAPQVANYAKESHANTSDILDQYARQIIENVNKAIEGKKTSPAQTQKGEKTGKQATMEELREMLREAQKEYQQALVCRNAEREALKELMAKMPEMTKAIVAALSKLEEKDKKMKKADQDKIDELKMKVADIEGLISEHKDNTALVSMLTAQKDQINKLLKSLQEGRDLDDLEMVGLKAQNEKLERDVKVKKENLEKAEQVVAEKGQKKGALAAAIVRLQKEKTRESKNGSVNVVTEMYKVV